MKSLKEIRDEMKPYYLSDQAISKAAYEKWEKDGRHDGEEIVTVQPFGQKMKLREWYWISAKYGLECLLDIDCEIIRSFELSRKQIENN